MTAQQKVLLAPPALKEAQEGVLYVHNLIDPAHGLVPSYANMVAGQTVKFTVQPSYGNHWSAVHVVTAAEVGKTITVAIPKHVFEKNLVAGATAKLHYSVVEQSGNEAQSPDLVIKVEK
ncbi:hypothetical protein KRR23_10165 [Pseudomonas sp. CVAP|uniref:hypothetical protein n=1 Tax=Pseudomonas sp. CVAP\|nr:hypothetical protein [Pseudomonas sp. CVAP\